MFMMRHRTAIAVLSLAFARTVQSQELRGGVRDSASGRPIPGAVVLLLDAARQTLARGMTNDRGAYRLALHPHAVRLRVVRIGSQPRELTLPTPVDGVARLDVVLARIPTL